MPFGTSLLDILLTDYSDVVTVKTVDVDQSKGASVDPSASVMRAQPNVARLSRSNYKKASRDRKRLSDDIATLCNRPGYGVDPADVPRSCLRWNALAQEDNPTLCHSERPLRICRDDFWCAILVTRALPLSQNIESRKAWLMVVLQSVFSAPKANTTGKPLRLRIKYLKRLGQ